MELNVRKRWTVAGLICFSLTLILCVWAYTDHVDYDLKPVARHDGHTGSSSAPYQHPTSSSGAQHQHVSMETGIVLPQRRQDDAGFHGSGFGEDDEEPSVMTWLADERSSPINNPTKSGEADLGMMPKIKSWMEERKKNKRRKPLASGAASIMTYAQIRRYNASNFLKLDPPPYLPHYRSPCWRQEDAKEEVYIQCLPSVFLAGFPKCGTTELFETLLRHPALAYGNHKEPHYWTRNIFMGVRFPYYLRNYRVSSKQITHCEGEVGPCSHPVLAVDGSASTIWDNSYWQSMLKTDARDQITVLPPRILHHLIPDLKVIAIMRDPVPRLYSDYLYFHRNKRKSPELFHQDVLESLASFRNCTSTNPLRTCAYTMRATKVRLNVGLYHVFIREWVDVISRERMHLLRLEDFSKDRDAEMNKITDFLRIGRTGNYVVGDGRSNQGHLAQRIGPMLNTTKELLQQFYASTNHQLAALLGDDGYTWGY